MPTYTVTDRIGTVTFGSLTDLLVFGWEPWTVVRVHVNGVTSSQTISDIHLGTWTREAPVRP